MDSQDHNSAGDSETDISHPNAQLEILPVPPNFLMADNVSVPITDDGFLRAPEPSMESSEIWRSQVFSFPQGQCSAGRMETSTKISLPKNLESLWHRSRDPARDIRLVLLPTTIGS
ncbi:hypothetical protein PIB30_046436 [Stylosanthes scabra]|uniref:Uncharacterized protein n=1 Tax=Stylosanthes scabra TaxID=79078 RepID=A0ABU6XHP9_9FABA|nr:hypothetical protein [Stylosanthes scabra]